MKKALVTGSEGFIGKHLVRCLKEQGYAVQGFDLKLGKDIQNAEAVEASVSECDVVFHLAGLLGTHELVENPEPAVCVNVLGTLYVLEAARKRGVEVVTISKPNVWLNTYTITKRAAEEFTLMYAREHRLKAWVARCFNVYGPGQKYGTPQKLAPTAIVRAVQNEPIPVFGDGAQTTDHIYVEDAVRALVAVYKCSEAMGKSVDVGSGKEISVNDFIGHVVDLTGSRSQVEHLPMRRGEDEGAKIRGDVRFLSDVVGFRPSFDIRCGLERTITYYREHPESRNYE